MAWLYVPDMEELTSDSRLHSETDTALYVTLSGKPSARLLSWRGWKTRPWIRLLSGTIFSHSTAARGVESWISSLRGSLVSPGQSPELSEEPTTNAGYGLILCGSFAKWDPDLSCWKTYQASLLGEDWGLCSVTWPRWGSMLSGVAFRRLKSARVISASGSSYWHTARATDTGAGENPAQFVKRNGDRSQGCTGSLAAQVMWPTARAEDSENCGNHPGAKDSLTGLAKDWQTPGTDSFRSRGGDRKDEMGLDQQARFWATPRASANENRTTGNAPSHGNGHGLMLAGQAASWPTPTNSDHKGTLTQFTDKRCGTPETQALSTAVGVFVAHSLPALPTEANGAESSKQTRRLNPLFVEWLMGLPVGWTGCECVETESFRSWLHTHSVCLRRLLGSEG